MFQPHILSKVYQLLGDGHTRQSVCDMTGVTSSTFGSWMHKGQTGLRKHDKYAEFRIQVGRCEEDATILLMDRIKEAAQKDWRAAAWVLERTRPEFKLNPTTSLEHRRVMDTLKIEAQRVEIALTEAKLAAIQGGGLSDGQILEILPIHALEHMSDDDELAEG